MSQLHSHSARQLDWGPWRLPWGTAALVVVLAVVGSAWVAVVIDAIQGGAR